MRLIACARHGATAALAAPFKPKDAQLFAIISAFDAAYTAYAQNQAAMERFWTLQYLRQNAITHLTASALREQAGGAWLVRAEELPLTLTVMGASGMARGSLVRVKLGYIDDIALDVSGSVTEVLSASPASAPPEAEDEAEEAGAGPIAIAVDLADGDGEPAPGVAAAG